MTQTYKHSVDKYLVTFNKGEEDETTVTVWASELGLTEWLPKQHQVKSLNHTYEYEIIEKGIVQAGQPVIKFNAAGERIN